MNEQLIRRVRNSLNKQCYSMNESWLLECIEYYLENHENPTDADIVTFVINQWLLCDLREINNEKGCLPENLANVKCTTLSGKYILQMDKIYDISQSKYKQLEKIRNVSSENVEATENENNRDDKTQNWEPKSKRMLQLFLTDGMQDVSAIEYKPIRFLKDSIYPGYKLLIKGPVICRKGVMLLEESNISEVGGEVESILIVNAVENIFARALNLELNPDPYNDNNKQTENTQNTESIQRTTQMEEDFDINTEVIDQIDRQFQQNSTGSKTLVTSETRSQQRPTDECSSSSANNHQDQNYRFNNRNQSYGTTTQSTCQSSSVSHTSKMQKQSCNYNIQSSANNSDDEADLFLNMVDVTEFEKLSSSKQVPKTQQKSATNDKSNSSRVIQNIDDFPMDDEMYDLVEEQSPHFSATKIQNNTKSVSKPISTSSVSSYQTISRSEKSKQLDITSNYECKSTTSNISKQADRTSKFSSKEKVPNSLNYNTSVNSKLSSKSKIESIPSTSYISDFPDDDFDMGDFDMEDDLKEYFSKDSENEAKEAKPNQTSNKLSSRNCEEVVNSVETNIKQKFNPTKEIEFDTEENLDDLSSSNKQKETKPSLFQKSNQVSTSKYEKKGEGISSEFSGVKRLASTSPVFAGSHKMRCLQSTPKDKSSNRKITDFLNKSSEIQSQEAKSAASTGPEHKSSTLKSNESDSTISLLSENAPRICEYIKDVLKTSLNGEEIHTVVRGKVVNIVKLNLLKNEKGNYFHLEGTITDDTGNLDVVFSSKVLEELIGYSCQVFVQKRKQSKSNPAIKDELREDLKKAQELLKVLDVLMEIKYKVNERAHILNIMKLSKYERKYLDFRL